MKSYVLCFVLTLLAVSCAKKEEPKVAKPLPSKSFVVQGDMLRLQNIGTDSAWICLQSEGKVVAAFSNPSILVAGSDTLTMKGIHRALLFNMSVLALADTLNPYPREALREMLRDLGGAKEKH